MKRLDRELKYRETGERRHESCKHYRKCLDRAVDEKWKSFVCDGCDDYAFVRIIVELTQEELNGPPVENKFDTNKFNAQIVASLRKKGQLDGNSQWRGKAGVTSVE